MRPEGPKISVIVPVFNAEPFIERCLESLLAQTLRELELVVVDDRGQDGSMAVVERHAANDSRIRILRNPQNLGPGASRNAGMAVARGEYLGFCDSDDWVDAGFYEELYSTATAGDYDIVKGLRVDTTGDVNLDCRGELRERAANRLARRLLDASTAPIDCFPMQHTTVLYSSRFVMRHDMRNGDTRLGEDVAFLVRVLHHAEKLTVLDAPKHVYRRRLHPASATRRFDLRHYEEELRAKRRQIGYVCAHFAPLGIGYRFSAGRIAELLLMHDHMQRDPALAHLAPAYLRSIRDLALSLPDTGRLERSDRLMLPLILPLTRFGVNVWAVAHRTARSLRALRLLR